MPAKLFELMLFFSSFFSKYIGIDGFKADNQLILNFIALAFSVFRDGRDTGKCLCFSERWSPRLPRINMFLFFRMLTTKPISSFKKYKLFNMSGQSMQSKI